MTRKKGINEGKTLDGDRWYPWSKNTIHICCNCNQKHDVNIKIDKRGVVWMKWSEME